MRTPLPRLAASAFAAVVTMVLAVAPADAHPAPFDATAGGASAGQIAVTAVAGPFMFKDTTTGVTFTCASLTIPGHLVVGNDRPGSGIATLDASEGLWSDCAGPAGLRFQWTGYGTWSFDIDDVTNGVATGAITNMRAHVVISQGPTCSFDVGADTGTFTSSGTSTVPPGAETATYTNSSQALDLPASNPGSLGLWNVDDGSGHAYCITAALWGQGDNLSMSTSFHLTADDPGDNPIAIN